MKSLMTHIMIWCNKIQKKFLNFKTKNNNFFIKFTINFKGGVPPFGNLLGLPNYFDKSINNFENSAFNCGLNTESIIM